MVPQFLIPETVVRKDGMGSAIAVEPGTAAVQLTLGIQQIVEQESLDVSIWGSADQETWIQLAAFPQKFYCGSYSLVVALKTHPEVKMLRAQWRMGRWGRGDLIPMFGFYLFAEPMRATVKAG
jgi:hypothetical protein